MVFEGVGQSRLSEKIEGKLERTVESLVRVLGDNLYSVVLYGSAVRGGFVEGRSDINLMIVLQASTAASQAEIGKILAASPLPIAQFTLCTRELEKSMRCFAVKFRSIQRHHRVLVGSDFFGNFHIDDELLKQLLSQNLRNLRLRLMHNFIDSYSTSDAYKIFLKRFLPALFVDLTDVVGLKGESVPADFLERIPIFEEHLAIPSQVLSKIVELKRKGGALKQSQAFDIHHQLMQLMDAVIDDLEAL